MQSQTRREFLKMVGYASACGGALSLLSGCSSPGRMEGANRNRPNFIFIMSDDHASNALSCYGGGINKTPNLDRLANEGMRFTNSFCTNSICAPCRAVVLTGKYSHINGQINNRVTFDGTQQTFPKLLQEKGYQTAMIGKWHLKSDPTGFDYWNVLPGQGAYYNPEFIEMGERKQYTGYVTDLTTDFCIDWLRKRKSDKPFFLMCHHKAPHRNWMPGPEHLTMYDGVEIPEPTTLFDDYSSRSDAARQQKMTIADHMRLANDLKVTPPVTERDKRSWKSKYGRFNEEQRKKWDAAYGPKNEAFHKAKLAGKELTRWKYQRYIKDYLRCIASVDDNVGRLLSYLDESGLATNTIVVYTSDQGFFLGEHGWFDKRFMYEESLGMPLLLRYPKSIKPGSVSDDIVLNLDFAETFLDYAGVEVPSDMQGRSLRPILEGKRPKGWRNSMYYHYYEFPGAHSVKRHYGIRTKRYKLIHFYNDIDAWELYDLQKDPAELNNLYDNPDYGNIVNELKAELEKLRKQYGESQKL